LKTRLRIVVGGLLGLYPVGGWHYVQYLLGLSRLGHDVYYHEDTWMWPYHPIEKTYTPDGDYSAKYIRDFLSVYAPELCENWHYLHLHETSYGMPRSEFDEVCRSADIFLNVGGGCTIPEELSPNCVKVIIDTDPGYNQIVLTELFDWSENAERWRDSVAAHDRFLTYAENIHSPECLIPKLGFKWKTTRPPVVPDLWEDIARVTPSVTTPWTTIMSWNVFKGRLLYQGVEYKSKGSEFEKLMDLPRLTGAPLKVGVGGVSTEFRWFERHGWQSAARACSFVARARTFKRLARNGWQVVDGPHVTKTPAQYRDFIANSRGEISPAKHVYVAMRSGWFSERSVCYLAAGRPVIVQDTGFRSVLPTGEGLLVFASLEEAADAVRKVEMAYARHAKAAKAIAIECFGSDRVLQRLTDNVLSKA